MSICYIDIETIPGQSEWIKEEAKAKVSPPGTYKKEESIAKWMEENAEQEADNIWRKTALDGSRGEIFCISWAINDKAVESISIEGIGEKQMLEEFFLMLDESTKNDYLKTSPITNWVGHNITGFDLRFIWQRCVINGVKPSINIPYNAKPWDNEVFDTMVEWSGLNRTGTRSLDAVCKAFGMNGKGDIDGSKVWDYIKAGRYDEVVSYCKDDVKKVRELYKRMTFGG